MDKEQEIEVVGLTFGELADQPQDFQRALYVDLTSSLESLQQGLDAVKTTMDYWLSPKEKEPEPEEEKHKPPFQYSFSVDVSANDGSQFTAPTDWYIEVTADNKEEAEEKAYDAIKNMCRDVELEEILKDGNPVDASEIEGDL